MAKGKKLYGDEPTLEHDDKEGKVVVKKKDQSSTPAADEGDGVPMPARHAMERRDMNTRHETEHTMHDYGKGGSKDEMHSRHEQDMKAMHKKHTKELGKGETTGDKE